MLLGVTQGFREGRAIAKCSHDPWSDAWNEVEGQEVEGEFSEFHARSSGRRWRRSCRDRAGERLRRVSRVSAVSGPVSWAYPAEGRVLPWLWGF